MHVGVWLSELVCTDGFVSARYFKVKFGGVPVTEKAKMTLQGSACGYFISPR